MPAPIPESYRSAPPNGATNWIPQEYRRAPKREAAPPPCDREAYLAHVRAETAARDAVYPIVDLILVLTVAVVLLGSIALQRRRA